MKNLSLLAAALLAAVPATVHANSIDFTSFTASPTTLNLNDGSAAWAYYGSTDTDDYQADDGTPTTDAANVGNFTAFTVTTAPGNPPAYAATNPSSGTAITYTGGAGGHNSVNSQPYFDWQQIQNSGSGDYFTITSTLFAPTETFKFYLINYGTTSDFIASLSDGVTANDLTNVSLIGDPNQGSSAVLTLTVTGDIGDVLTFNDVVDNSGITNFNNYGGIVGLQAVTVEAAPEPSTYALLFAGLGLLVLVRRFRGKLIA